MDKEQFSNINEKLDIMTNLLAMQIIQGKEYRHQLEILSAAGVKTKTMAKLTGKTENNVTVTLHLMKKKETKPAEIKEETPNETAK